MKFYCNPAWLEVPRPYYFQIAACTLIIACAAPEDRVIEKWIECDATVIDDLQPLWVEDGVKYYGKL